MDALDTLRRLRRPLERAITYADDVASFESVYQDVAAGRMQVFSSGLSVVITQIQEYPRARVLQICYAAGRLTDMEPWMDEVFEWAREKGCTKVVMIGRRGWERSFLRNRLRPTNIVMEGSL